MKNRQFVALIVVGSTLVWLLLFHRFLFGLDGFGYRDTSHLYFPLFEWIQGEWKNGRIPLWNPLDDFGAPVVGDGVSSVFYPLKVIFFFNAVPYSLVFGWYVSIHLLIAAWGSYFLARRLQCSRAGSMLTVIGYSLGGSVLFQVNNVVYIVGAAWLPWALAFGWSAISGGGFGWTAGTAICVALMVLGGDPQSAYHTLLVLGLVTLFSRKRVASNLGPFGTRSLIAFLAIVLLAAGLSAIQWLPSYVWYQRSVRAASETQRSIWESAAAFSAGSDVRPADWFSTAPVNTHHEQIYQFSQPPWSMFELIWPNISGKEFPIYRRWTNAIPAADRVWTPSLYCGLVVFLLAVAGARWFSGRPIARSVTWLTILFALGSTGWYGAGWLLREAIGTVSEPHTGLQPPAFGIYWWMVVLLPGFAGFRYPAKLMVAASLGISLLAGLQLSSSATDRLKRSRRVACGVFALSAIGFFATFAPGLVGLMQGIPADSSFGPFDAPGAIRDLRITFVHALAVSGFFWLAVKWSASSEQKTRRGVLALVALALVDVAIANAWLLVAVPADTISNLNQRVALPQIPLSSEAPRRIRRLESAENQPQTFSESSSDKRLAEIIDFQHKSLFPKFHLTQKVELIGSFQSIEPLDLQWFNQAVRPDQDWLLGIEADSSGRKSPHSDRIRPAGLVRDWHPAEFSRQTYLDPRLRSQFIQSVRDDLACLERDEPLVEFGQSDYRHGLGIIGRIWCPGPTFVVESAGPVWLVVPDYWDPGWRVTLKDENLNETQVSPQRFAGIFTAVPIPAAGAFVVRFHYKPGSFSWGRFLSIATLSWIVVAFLAIALKPYFRISTAFVFSDRRRYPGGGERRS